MSPPVPAAPRRSTSTTCCSRTGCSSSSAASAGACPRGSPTINRLVTRLSGSSLRVDRSDRIFTSPRLVRFTEMEYSLPRGRTIEAVRRVLELVPRDGLHVPFPIEVRTVAADDALISTAAGRDCGFVAVHMFEGMPWEPYFRAVEAVMDELGGRPHWGKRHFQTAATLRHRYPDWDRFQAVRRRLDPEGRFANAYIDRVLGP
jgi:L-gulono-1,4-lactone dehydrogenase